MSHAAAGTAWGYIRVSTDGQVESGLGKGDQLARIDSYYETTLKPLGYARGEVVVDDGVSASKREFIARRGGGRLSRMAAGGDVIVFSKVDRAFRRVRNCLNQVHAWEQRGVRAVFLDCNFGDGQAVTVASDSQLGRMMLMMYAWFAEWEAGRIQERTAAAFAVCRRQDRKIGGRTPPYGYRSAKGKRNNLYPDVEARAVGAWMLRQAEAGHDFDRIARALNEAADPKARVNPITREPWDRFAVRRRVKKEAALQAAERAAGADGVNNFLMPSGRVVTVSDLPADARALLLKSMAENTPRQP